MPVIISGPVSTADKVGILTKDVNVNSIVPVDTTTKIGNIVKDVPLNTSAPVIKDDKVGIIKQVE